VDHFLLNHELHGDKRDELRRKMRVQGMTISVLLGDNKIIKDIMEYIKKTGRFTLEQR
jgi:hypothetical protein